MVTYGSTLETADAGHFLGLSLSLSRIGCPACKAPSALVETFRGGEKCPRCKIGVIEARGECIY